MEDFPHIHVERVRFSDCDPMGHANNAVFSTYLEQARIAVLGDLVPFILARVEIDFRAPARFGDEIEVGVRAGRFGTKSFDLEYELHASGRLLAEARSVCVAYDYERGEAMAIPEGWRERLAA